MLNRVLWNIFLTIAGLCTVGNAFASFDFGSLSLNIPVSNSDSEIDPDFFEEQEWLNHCIGKGANKSAYWDESLNRVVYKPHSSMGCGGEYEREVQNILYMEFRDYFSFQGICQYSIDQEDLIEAPLYASDLKKEISRPRFLSVKDERKIIASILRTVQNLNSADLYHFDIKPDNFFVDADGDLFLGDFGSLWSGELVGTPIGFSKYSKEIRRTTKYSAPEIEIFSRNHKKYQDYSPDQFTIWSAGITALELHAKWNGKIEEFKALSKILSSPFSKTALLKQNARLMQKFIDDIVENDPVLRTAFKHLLAPFGSRSVARALWYLETLNAYQSVYDSIINQILINTQVLL